MSIEELLKKLKIDAEPVENDNGSYTIDIDSSNEYSRYYSRLEKSNLFMLDDEASQISGDTSNMQFINDEFIITLLADFNTNEYKMIIRKVED